MTRSLRNQPDLFGAVRQPLRRKREKAAIYAAVRALRKRKIHVYRGGGVPFGER